MDQGIDFPSPNTFFGSNQSSPPNKPSLSTLLSNPPTDEKPKKKATTRKRAPKPVPTASNDPAADPAAPVKPKQTKSRNGCVTCKLKRLKCDEGKPACDNCIRRNVECGGYKKDYKWRPQYEDGLAPLPKPPSPANGLPIAKPPTPDEGRRDTKRSEPPSAYSQLTLPSRPLKAKKPAQPREKRQPVSPLRESSSRASQRGIDESLALSNTPSGSDGSPHHLDGAPQQQPFNPHSPTLTELLNNFSEEELTPSHEQSFINFSMPEDMSYPLSPAPLDPQLSSPHSNDPFHANNLINNNDMFNNGLPLVLTARRQTSNSASPLNSNPNDWQQQQYGPDWRGQPNSPYDQEPEMAYDRPESLAARWDKYTCGILSIMDGPRENPWRALVWPLAQRSQALYHALMAMTAFHASTDIPAMRVVGHEHKQQSIRFMSEGIRDDSIQGQMAIAAAIALGFAESWDQHTATGNTHIKGAQALVKQALAQHQQRPLHGIDLQRLKFLSNAYVYLDVLARLTSFDSDVNNDFDNFLFASNAPETIMDDQGFGIDFGMPIDARLDPLMGCANTLFPLIGRVANLVRRVCRSTTNSPAIISQANDLKLALESWDPPEFIETPEDRTTGIQHTLQTAEAYRWATILHLHQAVPEIPSPSSAELANRVLQYLATVPLVSRTIITHTMPLMIAGCEAAEVEDRDWVRERWNAMYLRTRLGNHEKCATVTEEVWRRRDAYEAQPSGRRRLVATSELHPSSRQKSTPLVRKDNGYEDMDPGRTGMVFSYVEEAEPKHDNGPRRAEHRRSPSRRSIKDRIIGPMDVAYTPRGHLHWVGVMWDWGWEVLLG